MTDQALALVVDVSRRAYVQGANDWPFDHERQARELLAKLAALPSDKGVAGEPLSHCVHGMPTKDFCAQCASNRQVNKWLAETAPYDCHARPDSGWRTIELDSPEDCDVVMLWWPGQSIRDYPFIGTTDDAETMRSAKATHWQPLPPQPNAEGVGNG